jgi:hypothetical protein
MKWIVLLSLWSVAALAQTPMVFMRESSAGKHVILRQGGTETALTSGKMWHLFPDISADGQWVVWVEGPNDRNLSVVLFNTRTRARERWDTGRRGATLHPRFTKDGQQIFFSTPERGGNKIVSFSPANSRTRLLALEADGTKVYRISPELVPHGGQGFFPRPSTDGTFVVFQQSTLFKKEIVEYNRVTKTSRVLAEGLAPALSNDEEWILYTTKVQGSWDVWIANRVTGDTVALTNDPEDEMTPTFTVNNDVAFASNKDKNFQLYQLVNGEWQRLVKSDGDDNAPMFAGEAQWQQSLRALLPTPRRSAFGSAQLAGRLYVCGGKVGNRAMDRLDVYDPALGRWSELAPRPHAGHDFPLIASGQYLYAFGETLDRYDTENNVWLTLGTMPRASASLSAVTIERKVYLLESGKTEVVVFDLATEKLTLAPWRLPARREFSASEYKQQIVLAGGDSRVTLVDPASGYGRELAPLPFAMSQPSIEVLGDDLLVFGGVVRGQARAGIYALSFSKNTWRHTGRFLSEAKGFSQIVPWDGGVAILGGQRSRASDEAPLATFEMFRKMK